MALGTLTPSHCHLPQKLTGLWQNKSLPLIDSPFILPSTQLSLLTPPSKALPPHPQLVTYLGNSSFWELTPRPQHGSRVRAHFAMLTLVSQDALHHTQLLESPNHTQPSCFQH